MALVSLFTVLSVNSILYRKEMLSTFGVPGVCFRGITIIVFWSTHVFYILQL